MAQDSFRVGITRDAITPSGEPICGRDALRILDAPGIEWEFLPEVAAEHDEVRLGGEQVGLGHGADQFALDRPRVLLHLPAAVARAGVLDREAIPGHDGIRVP